MINRAPAATPGSPAYRPHGGGRREEIEAQYGAGLISQDERRRGIPRTETERQARHEELFPGTPLPPRGTGLDRRGLSIGDEPIDFPVTIVKALIAGLGIAAGFAIFRKAASLRH